MKLSLAVAIVACAAAQRPGSVVRDHADQERAAVRLESFCIGEDPFALGIRWGSGVIVDDRHLLTARHVTACQAVPVIQATFVDGGRARLLVTREDAAADLALLELVSSDRFAVVLPAPSLAPFPAVGDAACAATAYPARETNCGFVEALSAAPSSNVRVGCRVRFGNSGAGVYDVAGRLIGIVDTMDGENAAGVTALVGHRGMLP